MRYDQNLHTHSIYCDGKDKPEDVILKAIDLGFSSIGFSGHAPMPMERDWAMTKEGRNNYIKEISDLKKKYEGQLDVFFGVEYDLFSDEDPTLYEYVISSVHFIKTKGQIVEFDRDANTVKRLIDDYFGGNGLAYAKCYYQTLATLPSLKRTDIVGHCDIITKHSEKVRFFDTDCKEYKDSALEGITAVAEKIKVFEINTGAISRGYRTTVYPAPFIMKRLKELGAKMVISSDCHDKNFLDCKFNDALSYLQSFGFDAVYKFDGKDFVPTKI